MIKNITYGSIREGASSGVMAYQVLFDGDRFPPNQIQEAIGSVLLYESMPSRIIVFDGVYPEEDSGIFLSLLMQLKDKGFKVQVNSSSGTFLPWFTTVDRLVIHASSREPQLSFACSEFVYHLHSNDPIVEPDTPASNPNLILCIKPEGMKPADVFSFLWETKKVWRIYPEMKKTYLKKIYEHVGG